MFCVVHTVYITLCEFMFSMMLFSLIQWLGPVKAIGQLRNVSLSWLVISSVQIARCTAPFMRAVDLGCRMLLVFRAPLIPTHMDSTTLHRRDRMIPRARSTTRSHI